jgi:hypothetical protein
MSELRVFKLVFAAKHHLEFAFEILVDAENVPSCSIEPETVSARFMATLPDGNVLVERFYADGGLRWCSRHRVRYGDR